MTDLAEWRRTLAERGLREGDLGPDPFPELRAWLSLAFEAGQPEPTAVALATVDGEGWPNVRLVLLKDIEPASVTFFTNTQSAKGRELAVCPRAAITVPWTALGRQVRLVGPVEPVTDDEADAYFATRPRGSQLGAWASPQSEALSGRDELEARLAEVAERFEGGDVPRPPHWSGYRLTPAGVEFWQHRDSRLHDRIRYVRDGGGWRQERLAP